MNSSLTLYTDSELAMRQRQLLTFLLFFKLTALGFGTVFLIFSVVLKNLSVGLVAAIIYGIMLCFHCCTLLAGQQKVYTASIGACVSLVVTTIMIVIVLPPLYPALLPLTSLSVLNIVPYISHRAVRLLTAFAAITSLGVVLVGHSASRLPLPPPWFVTSINSSGSFAGQLLLLVLCFQFRDHLLEIVQGRAQAELAAALVQTTIEKDVQIGAILGTMNHEIRNASTSVASFLPIVRLMLDEIDPTLRLRPSASGHTLDDMLDAQEQGTAGMTLLAEHIMLITRDHPLVLDYQVVDPTILFQHVAAEVHARARCHLQPISVVFEPQPAIVLRCNQGWVEAALRTAARNAFDSLAQHLESQDTQGIIRLSITATATTIELRIDDNGPGFPTAYLDRLQSVESVNDTMGWTTKSGGSGLGIAFLLQVMKFHHGSVTFHNQVGSGACIMLHFPRVEDDHGTIAGRP